MKSNVSINRDLEIEFSEKEAFNYAYKRGKNTRFYYNVYGWETYYTLKPTFATPTGKLKGFPRSIVIKVN